MEELYTRPVTVDFCEPDLSSSGGALLLKKADESLGLTAALAECIADSRDAGKCKHDVLDLTRQRTFGIACGYEDANDVARFKNDGMQKLLCDKDPRTDGALASQSTMSRFENRISRTDLLRLAYTAFDVVAARHKKRLGRRAKVVTIDLDATPNFAHGQQQLAMFNGFYDGNCYLPLMAFLSFNDEPDQHWVATVLRPGNPGKAGVVGSLKRLIQRTRAAFPKAEIVVRLDGGFCGADVLDLLDAAKVSYLVGFGKNDALALFSAATLRRARRSFERDEEPKPAFGSTKEYSARSWVVQQKNGKKKRKKRRVIFKAEVVQHQGREPKENLRYVVTNLAGTAKSLYAQYVGRCDSENRIKEAKLDLRADRVSCSRFTANQFRAILAGAAFVLFQELRLRAEGTPAARWQVGRLRQCLIQVAGRITSSVRRLLVRLPREHPWADIWLKIATA